VRNLILSLREAALRFSDLLSQAQLIRTVFPKRLREFHTDAVERAHRLVALQFSEPRGRPRLVLAHRA